MNSVAVSIDHPVIQRFRRLADELEMCLVFGFAERIGDDVFNCAVFIDHDGEIRGKYHKMQLAEAMKLKGVVMTSSPSPIPSERTMM